MIRNEARPAAFDLIVIIASLGGLQSISAVLAGLPGDFPIPVLVLHHSVPREAPEVLARLLQRSTKLPVHTAADGDLIAGPGAAVLPRGYTARIDSDHRLRFALADRTGGDSLLSSAAEAAGQGVVALVLTGMLADGARGVQAIKRRGGRILAEDPGTARASSMPAHAIATGCVDFALPNHRLAAALIALTLAPGGAEMFTVPTPSWARLH
jgi:two-component system chemotaxis response regulator CheB